MRPEIPTLSRTAGVMLGACTVLSLLMVAMHPTIHAAPAGEVLDQLVKNRTLDGFVHGSLIAIMVGYWFGFAGLAAYLGLNRAPALLGLIAYGVGVIATIGAATIDGFVGPAFAAHVPADQAGIALDILIFASAAIQYLTKLGFVGLSLGMLACSVPLLAIPGLARTTGFLGVVAGGLPAGFILAFDPTLNPHVLIMILLVQAIWNLAAAALLLRGDRGMVPQPA
jgi:hypothetical protein